MGTYQDPENFPYPFHIWNFYLSGDKFTSWQVTCYSVIHLTITVTPTIPGAGLRTGRPLFLYRTIIGRCCLGVLNKVWHKIRMKGTFRGKIVLSWFPQDDMAKKEKAFRD